MKSSSARVGPVEVLEQEGDRARAGEPLEERPPGREQLGRAAGRRLADARGARAARARSSRRSASSGTFGARTSAILRAGRRGVVALEQARPRRGPSRPAPRTRSPRRTTGERPSCHHTRSTTPSTYLRNSHARRLLPMPAWPVIETSADALLARRRVEQVLEQPQLRVATDERRLEPLVTAPPARARRRRAGPGTTATGATLPLSTCSPAGSYAMAPLDARCVDSPTRTVPGGATRLEPRGGVDEVARDHALVAARRA